MAAIYALEAAFRALQAEVERTYTFDGGEPRVKVVWGRTRPNREGDCGSVGRVVVVPSAEDGSMGAVDGAQQQDFPAKNLLTLGHRFVVYVYAHDARAEHANDFSQDHAGLQLLHEVLRQLWNVGHNFPEVTSIITVGEPKLLRPKAQYDLGREYLVPCTIEQPILDMFDSDLDWIRVRPRGTITTTSGDHAEVATTNTVEP